MISYRFPQRFKTIRLHNSHICTHIYLYAITNAYFLLCHHHCHRLLNARKMVEEEDDDDDDGKSLSSYYSHSSQSSQYTYIDFNLYSNHQLHSCVFVRHWGKGHRKKSSELRLGKAKKDWQRRKRTTRNVSRTRFSAADVVHCRKKWWLKNEANR